jgi:hypothetical protein
MQYAWREEKLLKSPCSVFQVIFSRLVVDHGSYVDVRCWMFREWTEQMLWRHVFWLYMSESS